MRIKEILLELNVANVDNVEKWIDNFLNLIDAGNQPTILSWFKKQVRNYVLNNKEFAIPYTPNQNDEEWMHKAVRRGEQIDIIHVDVEFENQLGHVYDWLRWLTEQNNIEAKRILQKLPRLTVPMAIQKSEQWTVWLNKQATSDEDREGLKTVMKFDDGYRFVKLMSQQCYDREGKVMQHCIASYFSKNSDIYSLRDAENEPHVTMEMYGKDVMAVQGKQNKLPIKKYIPYIQKFIEKGNFEIVAGHKESGFYRDWWMEGSEQIDGPLYSIYDLPDNLSVRSMDLSQTEITKLPDNLTVNANLKVFSTNLKEIPLNLTVGLDFDIRDTDLPQEVIRMTKKQLTKKYNLKVDGKIIRKTNTGGWYPNADARGGGRHRNWG